MINQALLVESRPWGSITCHNVGIGLGVPDSEKTSEKVGDMAEQPKGRSSGLVLIASLSSALATPRV